MRFSNSLGYIALPARIELSSLIPQVRFATSELGEDVLPKTSQLSPRILSFRRRRLHTHILRDDEPSNLALPKLPASKLEQLRLERAASASAKASAGESSSAKTSAAEAGAS